MLQDIRQDISIERQFQKGYSLLELSIVILIISLLTGSILLGQALVRSAEVKQVISSVNDLKAAVSQFKDTYEGLPGDISNASGYWTGATNGNGNRLIAGETSDEAFAALDHLHRAEFLTKDYSGQWNNGFAVGTNVISFPDSYNGAYYIRCCSETDYARTLDFNNHITLFSVDPANDDFRYGALTPIEALAIDSKMDDGNPDTGFVGGSGSYLGTEYNATTCYEDEGSEASYLSANNTYKNEKGCQMHFAYDW